MKKNSIFLVIRILISSSLIVSSSGSFSFGFGSKGNAHIKNESVKIDNLNKGVKILSDYIKQLDDYFAA